MSKSKAQMQQEGEDELVQSDQEAQSNQQFLFQKLPETEQAKPKHHLKQTNVKDKQSVSNETIEQTKQIRTTGLDPRPSKTVSSLHGVPDEERSENPLKGFQTSAIDPSLHANTQSVTSKFRRSTSPPVLGSQPRSLKAERIQRVVTTRATQESNIDKVLRAVGNLSMDLRSGLYGLEGKLTQKIDDQDRNQYQRQTIAEMQQNTRMKELESNFQKLQVQSQVPVNVSRSPTQRQYEPTLNPGQTAAPAGNDQRADLTADQDQESVGQDSGSEAEQMNVDNISQSYSDRQGARETSGIHMLPINVHQQRPQNPGFLQSSSYYNNPEFQTYPMAPQTGPLYQGQYIGHYPQRVVSTRDFRDLLANEDLHEYFAEFDQSYWKTLTDSERISGLSERLAAQPSVRSTAKRLSGRYTQYSRFRNKILSIHGKTQQDVFDEFQTMEQEENETLTQFIERLEVCLSSPAGDFRRRDICMFIYDRLPRYYQRHIDRFSIKSNFDELRMTVNSIERDRIHTEMREMFERQEQLENRQGSTSHQVTNVQQAVQENQQQYEANKAATAQTSTSYTGKGKGNKGKSSYTTTQGYKQPPPPTTPYPGTASQNGQDKKEGIGANMFIENVGPEVCEVFTADQKRKRLDTIQESFSEGVPDSFNTTRIFENDDELMEDDSEAREKEQKNQAKYEDTSTSKPMYFQSQGAVKTPFDLNKNRGFQYLSKQQVNATDLQKQILEQRMNQESMVLLDRGTFTDKSNNLNVTKMLHTVCYPLTLFELYSMQTKYSRGQVPIYSVDQTPGCLQNSGNPGFPEEGQKPQVVQDHDQDEQDVSQFITQQVAAEVHREIKSASELAMSVVNVRDRGQHSCVDLLLNGRKISAIVDSGAVRSLISRQFVEALNLEEFEADYHSLSRFVTVSGTTDVLRCIRSAKIEF